MGDTIIKAFKDFTMWIGSLTVLPGEEGLLPALRIGFKRLSNINKKEDRREATPGASEKHMFERLTQHIASEELEQAEESDQHGIQADSLERDMRFYHFILSMEVGQLMKDVDASPPRQYTYQEWCYYLRLLGQDENDKSKHKKPSAHHQHGRGDSPDLATADDEDDQAWSWLGIRSPLMGNSTEAQWLLQRLSATLMSEMRNMNSLSVKKRRRPPISRVDLKARVKDQEAKDDKTLVEETSPAEVRRRGRSAV
jgi:potassium channel subfamily K